MVRRLLIAALFCLAVVAVSRAEPAAIAGHSSGLVVADACAVTSPEPTGTGERWGRIGRAESLGTAMRRAQQSGTVTAAPDSGVSRTASAVGRATDCHSLHVPRHLHHIPLLI